MIDGGDKVRDLFSRSGLRCTRQREEIYAALMASASHPTAEELFRSVRRTQPGLSLATVYNTLDAFTRSGICRRLAGAAGASGGACRYDAHVGSHVHTVSMDGEVRDVPTDLGDQVLAHLPQDLMRQIERRMGVKIQRIGVELMIAEQIMSGKTDGAEEQPAI